MQLATLKEALMTCMREADIHLATFKEALMTQKRSLVAPVEYFAFLQFGIIVSCFFI